MEVGLGVIRGFYALSRGVVRVQWLTSPLRRSLEMLSLLARGSSLLCRQYHIRRRFREEEMFASIGGLL
jgi:hypothetical protein